MDKNKDSLIKKLKYLNQFINTPLHNITYITNTSQQTVYTHKVTHASHNTQIKLSDKIHFPFFFPNLEQYTDLQVWISKAGHSLVKVP